MLDPKLLREQPEYVAEQLARRHFIFDANNFTRLDAQRKKIQIASEELQHQRKSLSKQIGQAKAKGKPAEDLFKQVETLAEEMQSKESALLSLQTEIQKLMLSMPNLPFSDVPCGDTEADNVFMREWGDIKKFPFPPLDHVSLGEKNNGIDFDNAVKITGSRFSVLCGKTARLHRALTQFMLDLHIEEHGYTEVYVPYIVNADSLRGTGQLPKFEADLFKVGHQEENNNRNFYLIPTAEVPVTNLWRDRILTAQELPCKYVAHTPCFRSEAGSYGRDTRGMIRQHQFDKVELVQCVRPEDSWNAFESLVGHAEEVLKRLEIPYRVVNLCTGDLGFSAAKTVDIEAWIPSQNQYREISSCSNFLDFQARRMKARWRNPENKKPELLHTLNGSGLAVGRTLVAIMENFQNEDGSINIPSALQRYTGVEVI